MKKICKLDDLTKQQARSFPYNENYTLIVYRSNEQVFGYLNRCPHAGVPLEWNADEFMSPDGTSLQCSTHGAQFEPTTGFCTFGPCQGASLEAIRLCVKNKIVYIARE